MKKDFAVRGSKLISHFGHKL